MISIVYDIVKQGIGFFKEKQKGKHDMKMAGLENRARLLRNEQEMNHEWEMKTLETSSKSLKHLSFFLFAGPILVTVVSPSYGGEIWNNLEKVPAGFMEIYYAITGAIWGISALKDSGINLKSLLKK